MLTIELPQIVTTNWMALISNHNNNIKNIDVFCWPQETGALFEQLPVL